MKAPGVEVNVPSFVTMLKILQEHDGAVMIRSRDVGMSWRKEWESVEMVGLGHSATNVRDLMVLCWRERRGEMNW